MRGHWLRAERQGTDGAAWGDALNRRSRAARVSWAEPRVLRRGVADSVRDCGQELERRRRRRQRLRAGWSGQAGDGEAFSVLILETWKAGRAIFFSIFYHIWQSN